MLPLESQGTSQPTRFLMEKGLGENDYQQGFSVIPKG
jgi:hypothetical protein